MHPLQDRTMDTTPAPDEATGPIKNMRIRFWGVQGSCPIFPSLREVSEYARRIATHTLQRAFEDLTNKVERGENLATLLGRLNNADTLASYQETIGLPDLPVYGGDTTCVEVETNEGNVLVFDA